MCCTAQPAVLTNTTIYAAEAMHPTEGLVHVVGYQNKAHSIGPNAMMLPIPAVPGTVTPANLVNAASFKDILNEYSEAVERLKPRFRGFSKGLLNGGNDDLLGSAGFTVFESGSYTVVLAKSSKFLAEGVKGVPDSKRPNISEAFADILETIYPETPIALCCFQGNLDNPEPLFWWYKPKNPEELTAPALDAHDGGTPRLNTKVRRDHTLAFASSESDRQEDYHLARYISGYVPQEHQWMFSAKVCGRQITHQTDNGDFLLSVRRARIAASGGSWLGDLFKA